MQSYAPQSSKLQQPGLLPHHRARPTMRPYQQDIIDSARHAIQTFPRVCLQLPTGAGKTPVLSEIILLAHQRGKRSIVIAHRTELIQQAANKLRDVGLVPNIIQASIAQTPGAHVDVASIQTLNRRQLTKLYDLIFIDEAHHTPANTYQKFIESQPYARVIGLTATPCKANGQGLHTAFDHLVIGPQPSELVEMGFLAPVEYIAVPSDDLSSQLATAKTTGGDYNLNDLGVAVGKSILYGDLVSSYKQFAAGMRCLVFAVNVELSKRYADEYNEAGIPAVHIDGDTPTDTRLKAFADFASGRIRVLTNCNIATEGVDIPAVDAVQIVRPTRSLPLYLQMVGRAVRPHTGKTKAVVIDHGNCHTMHGLPQEDRLWSLTGKVKRPAATVKYDQVPVELPESEQRKGPDHLTAYRLVPINTVDPALEKLMRIVDRDELKKPDGKPDYHWAFRKWLDGLGRPATIDELKYVQRRSGYHPNWVKHQMGEKPQMNWKRKTA